jgi:hypothetical protein
MHPIAWITIRALTGPAIQTVDLRASAERSPRLLVAGVALSCVGVAVLAVVLNGWHYVLSVTKNSVAAAAGGVAAGALLALLGCALIYASRAVRSSRDLEAA